MGDLLRTPSGNHQNPGEILTQNVGYVARQPILDRRGAVFGYELHLHEPFVETPGNPARPGLHALLDAVGLFGVERFTGGSRAFIACTCEMLMEGAFEGLPPSGLVLQIPAPTEISPRLLRACRKLKEAGFQLALSESEAGERTDGFIQVFDYIKIDAAQLESAEWDQFLKRRLHGPATVVGDNVHSHETYRTARGAGLEYFKGFYFSNPELIPGGRIPANRIWHFEMLRELFKDPLDLKSLCPLVERDPSLLYRVLRFINSPLCAVRMPVTSIEMAIIMLGDATFRRIATLAIQCAASQHQSPELVNMAMTRSRFCASGASLAGLDADEQYLVGMISLLPPMLGVTMGLILPGLPLRDPVRDALAGIPVKERCLLSWIEALENDRVAECESLAQQYRLDRHELMRFYIAALEEARAVLSATEN